MGVKQAPPRDPETKGIVERHNRYLETSFFPGRSFRDHHDAQHQLDNWIGTVANQRIHATLKQRPIDRWKDEKTTEYLPQDPVDTLKHRIGEQIQCDLMFPAGGIPNDTGGVFPAPVLVMVASYSRFMAATHPLGPRVRYWPSSFNGPGLGIFRGLRHGCQTSTSQGSRNQRDR